MENHDNLFLVVTATGGAHSLSSLTKALHGQEVSKPLAMISSDGSLLQKTVASFQSSVPARHMFVLVSANDETRARAQLGAWPEVNVMALPEGHASACALLLVLAEILTESPQAEVVLVSADRYFANHEPFVEALMLARDQLGLVPAVLMGAAADGCAPGQELLLPGAQLGEEIFALTSVHHPVSESACASLVEQEAMLATSAFIARGPFLYHVLARALPATADAISHMWRTGHPSSAELASALRQVTTTTCMSDAHALLLREIGSVAVARVKGAGYSDWETPEQVFHSLRSPFELAWLLSRLRVDSPAAGTPNAARGRPTMDLDDAPGSVRPGGKPVSVMGSDGEAAYRRETA